jgi:hypothetical protein
MMKSPVRVTVWRAGALLAPALAVALLGCSALHRAQREVLGQKQGAGDLPAYGQESSETDFRAVLMSNGMVLFGKLHGLGTAYPVLTDVYYVRTVQNAAKQATSVLVKRGDEWHAPDRTILNAKQIVLIEPVTKDSKVMQVIAELQKKAQ